MKKDEVLSQLQQDAESGNVGAAAFLRMFTSWVHSMQERSDPQPTTLTDQPPPH